MDTALLANENCVVDVIPIEAVSAAHMQASTSCAHLVPYGDYSVQVREKLSGGCAPLLDRYRSSESQDVNQLSVQSAMGADREACRWFQFLRGCGT